jgi:hypothetical protein
MSGGSEIGDAKMKSIKQASRNGHRPAVPGISDKRGSIPSRRSPGMALWSYPTFPSCWALAVRRASDLTCLMPRFSSATSRSFSGSHRDGGAFGSRCLAETKNLQDVIRLQDDVGRQRAALGKAANA